MHPLDRPIGSDLSFQVFQKRRRLSELGLPELNDQNRRLHNLPSQIVQREAYIASRETVHDADDWELERQQRRARG